MVFFTRSDHLSRKQSLIKLFESSLSYPWKPIANRRLAEQISRTDKASQTSAEPKVGSGVAQAHVPILQTSLTG